MFQELTSRVIMCDTEYDLDKRLLYFQAASMSLEDLLNLYRRKLGKKFSAEDLLYIFYTGAEFVFFLYQFGLFHGDIKEHNLGKESAIV